MAITDTYEKRKNNTFELVEKAANNTIEELEKEGLDIQDVGTVEVKIRKLISKLEIPTSSFYHHTLHYDIIQKYSWVAYVEDTGKFVFDLREFVESEQYNDSQKGDGPQEEQNIDSQKEKGGQNARR